MDWHKTGNGDPSEPRNQDCREPQR